MIRLTRLNGSEMFLNADLIATVESHPDTVITLIDGKHFVVAETSERVVERISSYRAGVLALADQVADATHPNPNATAPGTAGQAALYVLHGGSHSAPRD